MPRGLVGGRVSVVSDHMVRPGGRRGSTRCGEEHGAPSRRRGGGGLKARLGGWVGAGRAGCMMGRRRRAGGCGAGWVRRRVATEGRVGTGCERRGGYPRHICICICIYVHICVYMCIYVYICAYMYAYVYAYVCLYMCIHIDAPSARARVASLTRGEGAVSSASYAFHISRSRTAPPSTSGSAQSLGSARPTSTRSLRGE